MVQMVKRIVSIIPTTLSVIHDYEIWLILTISLQTRLFIILNGWTFKSVRSNDVILGLFQGWNLRHGSASEFQKFGLLLQMQLMRRERNRMRWLIIPVKKS
jgi:hypothetical protein